MAQSLDDLQLPPIPELLETERAFAAEPVDPAWATATEGQILGKFAEAAGIKLVTLRVECKTSLCRVQVAEPELSGANPPAPAATAAGGGRTVRVATFLELVSGLGLDPRWAMTVTDRQGTLTSFAYLARGGSAKPEDGAGAIR